MVKTRFTVFCVILTRNHTLVTTTRDIFTNNPNISKVNEEDKMNFFKKIKEEKDYQSSMFVPERSVLHKHVIFEISRIFISKS